MTPESCIGLLHMLDHWRVMLAQLQGQPLPELPAQPGRVHKLPEPSTVQQDAQQRDAEQKAAAAWRALAEGEGSGDRD